MGRKPAEKIVCNIILVPPHSVVVMVLLDGWGFFPQERFE